MKPAKRVTVRLVGTQQRRTFTLMELPFPAVGDLVRLREKERTKAGELDWEVIKVEDTQAFIIPRPDATRKNSVRSGVEPRDVASRRQCQFCYARTGEWRPADRAVAEWNKRHQPCERSAGAADELLRRAQGFLWKGEGSANLYADIASHLEGKAKPEVPHPFYDRKAGSHKDPEV